MLTLEEFVKRYVDPEYERQQQQLRAEKPRMRQRVYYDCGWRYEYWTCRSSEAVVHGRTAKEAYRLWLSMVDPLRVFPFKP